MIGSSIIVILNWLKLEEMNINEHLHALTVKFKHDISEETFSIDEQIEVFKNQEEEHLLKSWMNFCQDQLMKNQKN